MSTASFSAPSPQGPPPEYEAAMDDIEARAARGELTGAKARQEIHALRERFAVDAGVVMQWAMQPRGVALRALLATSLHASGIAPRVADTFAPLLSQACARFDICTPARVAAFVAQCAFESRGFVTLEEGMLYRTPEHICATWPERVPDPAHAERLVGAPQLLADTVYSDCWGNGDAASGDGWRYRGRGLIRLLGRATYRDAGAALGRPYEQEPDLVARTQDACLTAAWLWHERGLNELADRLQIDAIARHARDPRSNALPERRALFRGALAALEERPGQAHHL